MPSPLLPSDHYILRKLCDELLPWMISGKKIGRQWFVHLAIFYSYTSDLAAALAGLGIGAPVAALIQGQTVSGQNALEVLRAALPKGWFVTGVIAAIVWIILRLVVQREDVVKRALLAREYARAINASYAQLYQALATSDPMPQISVIQKSVDDRVQDAIKNGIWPWDPPVPPSAEIEVELRNAIVHFRTVYMPRWAPSPAGDIP